MDLTTHSWPSQKQNVPAYLSAVRPLLTEALAPDRTTVPPQQRSMKAPSGGYHWPFLPSPSVLSEVPWYRLLFLSIAMVAISFIVGCAISVAFLNKADREALMNFFSRGHLPTRRPSKGAALRFRITWIYREEDESLRGLQALTCIDDGLPEVPFTHIMTATQRDKPMVVYCIDFTHDLVVFLEVQLGADLLAEPFLDRGSRRLAGDGVVVATVETVWEYVREELDTKGDNQKLLCIWNTGRCGSTLVHRLLLAADVCSLSEPYWLEQLSRAKDEIGDEATRRFLRLCIDMDATLIFSSRPQKGSCDTVAINPKGIGHSLLHLVRAEFPMARHIFLYRDAVRVVESLASIFYYVNSPPFRRPFILLFPSIFLALPPIQSQRLRAWVGNRRLKLSTSHYLGDIPTLLTLIWLDGLCTWIEVTENWPAEDKPTMRMEELVDPSLRNKVVTCILERFVGVPLGKMEDNRSSDLAARCQSVFNKHSQAGSRMEKSSAITGRKFLTAQDEMRVRELLTSVPDKHVSTGKLPHPLLSMHDVAQ